MAGYSDDKQDHLKRLRRIEGQVRGLQRMVEEDTYCVDVLTQIASATKALQGVGLSLLDDHMRHCVRDSVDNDADHGEAKLDEVMVSVSRLLRS